MQDFLKGAMFNTELPPQLTNSKEFNLMMKTQFKIWMISGLLALAPAVVAQPTAAPAKETTKTAKKSPAPATPPPTAAEIADAKSKGLVWVNLGRGVYHMSTGEFYGKTKRGKFMAEADAKKAGYHVAGQGAVKKKAEAKAATPAATKK